MDSETLYSIFGTISLMLIAYVTLNKNSKKVVRTKDEVINEYKESLQKSLKGYEPGDEARKAKKIMVLREYSETLHKNIFFNEEEIKEIISELAAE